MDFNEVTVTRKNVLILLIVFAMGLLLAFAVEYCIDRENGKSFCAWCGYGAESELSQPIEDDSGSIKLYGVHFCQYEAGAGMLNLDKISGINHCINARLENSDGDIIGGGSAQPDHAGITVIPLYGMEESRWKDVCRIIVYYHERPNEAEELYCFTLREE